MQIKEDKIEEMEFDILTEIGNIGAGNATTALAKLINGRVDMYVPKVELLAFKDLAEILGGAEELVAGILLSLEGDIEGSMLFVLENNAAHHLVHRLMGSDGSDVTDEFTEMELSALLEIGNIIARSLPHRDIPAYKLKHYPDRSKPCGGHGRSHFKCSCD